MYILKVGQFVGNQPMGFVDLAVNVVEIRHVLYDLVLAVVNALLLFFGREQVVPCLGFAQHFFLQFNAFAQSTSLIDQAEWSLQGELLL